MKKKILSLVLVVVALFLFIPKANAATGTISVSSNRTQVTVGNTVTFTVKVSTNTGMVAFQYNINYDSSLLTLTSGNASGAPTFNNSTKNLTYTFTFKAKKAGTATFKFNADGAAFDTDDEVTFASASKSVTIITQQQLQNSYSKNNYLSKLGVDGYSITPNFNKETLEYNLTVENNIRSINVTGTKEDSRSTVSGLGKHDLEEGTNKINIVVTAENGSSRTYTLNVTVKELTPIVVAVYDQELTVVRKKELLQKPSGPYDETVIKINEEEVPAFYNEITDTTLVGLKDESGNIALYIYKDGKYSIYKSFSFDSVIIIPTENKDMPKGFVKTSLTLEDQELEAYKEEDNDNFYLLNGININTGKENLYQYNKEENSLQIYNSQSIDKLSKNIDELEGKNKTYLYVIIGLGCLLILTYITILISSLKKGKKKGKEFKKVEKIDIKEEEQVEEEKKEKTKKKEKVGNRQGIDTLRKLDEVKKIVTIEENNDFDNDNKFDDLSSNDKKIKKVSTEIEKKKKKDAKIKEDISVKSKKRKE